MFDFSNICSPRYTYTFLLKLSFKKLTFKKVFWGKEYTYTLDFEKLLKNLLLKNFCKRSGTRTLEFWKSFWKVGGKRVHWIFWKLNYLIIMNRQIIIVVHQSSRTAYRKCFWIFWQFKDVPREKKKTNCRMCIYNRRKNTSLLPGCFFKSR